MAQIMKSYLKFGEEVWLVDYFGSINIFPRDDNESVVANYCLQLWKENKSFTIGFVG